MTPVPETRDSLLLRLANAADHEAWSQFMAIYQPVIYRVARRWGLQDADAQDLTQRVLLSVSRAIDQWQTNPQRARFRTWFHTVTRNAVFDHLRAAQPCAAEGGTTARLRLQEAVDQRADHVEAELNLEVQREVFRWAAREVRAEFEEATWRAFWLTAVEGQAARAVADRLDKSVGAIYVARSRVMQRLRDKVTEYDADVVDPPVS